MLYLGVQAWVIRVKSSGHSTHPWGAPVFVLIVLEVLLLMFLILT